MRDSRVFIYFVIKRSDVKKCFNLKSFLLIGTQWKLRLSGVEAQSEDSISRRSTNH